MEYQEDWKVSPKASFTALSAELRRMIWLATFEPRYLGLRPLYSTTGSTLDRRNSDQSGQWFCTFTAELGVHWGRKTQLIQESGPHPVISKSAQELPPPGPIALQVCRESRAVALEHYEQAFGGTAQRLDYRSAQEWIEGGYGHGRIWVDFKRDIICYNELLEEDPLPVFPNLELMKVETLVLHWQHDIFRGFFLLQDVMRKVPDFWSLKTLRIYWIISGRDIHTYDFGDLQLKLLATLDVERAKRLPWVPPRPRLEFDLLTRPWTHLSYKGDLI